MTYRQHLVLPAAALFAALAPAQTNPRLIGLTSTTPLVVTQDIGTCAQAACPPLAFPPVTIPMAGGTAHDPSDRGTFVSNGLDLAKVDSRNQCVYLCPPIPMPNTTPNNPVTGLAYNEITRTLWVTDLSGVIRWYGIAGGCQPSLISRCIPPVGGGVLTGCATDDYNGWLFYCAVIPGTPGGRVFVAPQSNPCVPFCSFPLNSCGTMPMGPLTGLAWDACKRTVWATDGKLQAGLQINVPTCTILGQVQCCINTIEPLVGLCLLPSTETSAGLSCSVAPCPNCPNRHVLGGDPTLGNPGFSLDLRNGPGQASAWLFVNVGPCGPGLFSPPLCAPIRVPFVPTPFYAGPIGTGGTAGSCNGNVVFPFPIPAIPALCGLVLSSQYYGTCGSGHFVSNCLSWMLGSS